MDDPPQTTADQPRLLVFLPIYILGQYVKDADSVNQGLIRLSGLSSANDLLIVHTQSC